MGRSRGPLAAGEDDGGWLGGQRSKRRRFASGNENLDSSSAAGEPKRALYHCNYCNKDISGTIRIKCAKCVDFDLCLECFSVGVEVTTHKSNHPYRVIDNLPFPLIHPDWNADEEILLLEGVEMYGLGNWAEVAEHVGTKNKAQCYDHYMSAYMNSPCSPLPDMSHAAGKSRAELLALAKTYSDNKRGMLTYGDATGSRMVKQETSVSPSRIKVEDLKDRETYAEGRSPNILSAGFKDGAKPEPDDLESHGSDTHPTAGKKAAAVPQPKEAEAVNTTAEDGGQRIRVLGGKKPKPLLDEAKQGPSAAELAPGFNPKRQEFDEEYDNDAELPLAEMEFKDNDTETDREVKLQMLHIYHSRLDERKRRKEFILERGLLNVKRQQMLDRKRSKEERELYHRCRVFLRSHSTEEHDALLAGLSAELRIRQRIDELQEYRSAGCHTLAEGEAFMMEKKRRLAEASLFRKGRDGSALNNRMSNRFNRGRDGGEPSTSTMAATAVAAANGRELIRGGRSNSSAALSRPAVGMKTVPTMRKSSFPSLDVAGLPGIELLSQSEQDLCSQLRLLPVHYLKIKEVLMLENAKKGMLRRDDASVMFKIDPSKVESVFDFLSKMGWIGPSSR